MSNYIWRKLNKEEQDKHIDKIEKFYLSDSDVTISNCKERFGFPDQKIISKLLRERGNVSKKPKKMLQK